MPFPAVTPTSQSQASSLHANNAANAGLTNAVPLDRLTSLEQTVGNLLTDPSPSLGVLALPPAKFTLNAASGATTAAAGDMTGAQYVCAGYSAVGAAALTTRTAAQLFADSPFKVGDSYMLLITNTSGGTTTLTAGTGVTITGTATLATNTTRLFNVKFVSATAVTFQSVNIGTIG